MKKEHTPKKPHEQYRLRTRMIHGSFATGRWDYNHHVVPPQSSSATYRLSSVHRGAQGFVEFATPESRKTPIYIYDRLDEPSRGMLEENLAVAEGGEVAVAFATGMAAVSAALGVLTSAGSQIVAHRVLYGCTHSLMTNWLPRYNVHTDFCDLTEAGALTRVATKQCRAVYFETPVNPTMELIDMRAIRNEVDQLNAVRPEAEKIRIVVDNTFATPYCQRPLEHGVDLVVHSLTKGIGGFGTETGGAVIGPSSYFNQLMLYRKDFGGVLSPKNAWSILVHGLPTLAARMVNYQKSAMHVAEFLTHQPKVAKVIYPGLANFCQRDLARRQMTTADGAFAPGSMLYFEVKGKGDDIQAAAQAAERFVDHIAEKAYTVTLAVSLGQIKTLIENPFSMTHAVVPVEEKLRSGLQPGGIRLSLGLEDWHDITADLSDALEVI
jgi:cystathionine beta-lyase/cystathionine gamma-synthase